MNSKKLFAVSLRMDLPRAGAELHKAGLAPDVFLTPSSDVDTGIIGAEDEVVYFFSETASVATSFQALYLAISEKVETRRQSLINADRVEIPCGFTGMENLREIE